MNEGLTLEKLKQVKKLFDQQPPRREIRLEWYRRPRTKKRRIRRKWMKDPYNWRSPDCYAPSVIQFCSRYIAEEIPHP